MNFSSRGLFRFCQRGCQTTVESWTLSGRLGWPINWGKHPYAGVAYKWSTRFRPTCPLEFAMPVGQWRDLEFSMILAVSQQDAARMTTLEWASTSCLVAR